MKLTHLRELNDERRVLSETYLKKLDNSLIELPKVSKDCETVWHQFVIKTDFRDELISYLNRKEIATLIHYPIPPHLSEAYQYLNIKEGTLPIAESYAKQVISIPLYNGMTNEEQNWVIDSINAFEVR